jgi:hypothetical protein
MHVSQSRLKPSRATSVEEEVETSAGFRAFRLRKLPQEAASSEIAARRSVSKNAGGNQLAW